MPKVTTFGGKNGSREREIYDSHVTPGLALCAAFPRSRPKTHGLSFQHSRARADEGLNKHLPAALLTPACGPSRPCLKNSCPQCPDFVEKVQNTRTAKNSINQMKIYIRLLLYSQFDLERPGSHRRSAMRPSASKFEKRFHDAEKNWSVTLIDFFNRISQKRTNPWSTSPKADIRQTAKFAHSGAISTTTQFFDS